MLLINMATERLFHTYLQFICTRMSRENFIRIFFARSFFANCLARFFVKKKIIILFFSVWDRINRSDRKRDNFVFFMNIANKKKGVVDGWWYVQANKGFLFTGDQKSPFFNIFLLDIKFKFHSRWCFLYFFFQIIFMPAATNGSIRHCSCEGMKTRCFFLTFDLSFRNSV